MTEKMFSKMGISDGAETLLHIVEELSGKDQETAFAMLTLAASSLLPDELRDEFSAYAVQVAERVGRETAHRPELADHSSVAGGAPLMSGTLANHEQRRKDRRSRSSASGLNRLDSNGYSGTAINECLARLSQAAHLYGNYRLNHV